MDKEQEEIQFLGIFDIYKEAYKIIFSWRKIFSQITLTLILPLSLISLAHIQVSELLFRRMNRNEIILDKTKAGTPKYKKLSDHISSEWTSFWLFKAAYFTFLLIFFLLSMLAVVYTVTSIYTGCEVTFKKILSVVQKVWKRLMVTFLWVFIAFFAYNTLALIVLFATLYSINSTYNADLVIGIILLVIYLVGFVYLSLVWQLASVVSVLEDVRGIEAMKKSKTLIEGKMWVAILVFSKHIISVFLLQFAFQNLVVHGHYKKKVDRVGYAIICLLVLLKLILFGLVIQTILYFVCKSYHHENIDKLALSDHLEVYLGDYVPLIKADV
ncbi:hypothetical protein UlMin_021479 [Ulmus minor]